MGVANVSAPRASAVRRVRPTVRRRSYLLAGGRLATKVVDVTDDPAVLDGTGFWAVVVDFEGQVRCVRFADVGRAPPASSIGRPHRWSGPDRSAWTSSLDRSAYVRGVERVRDLIAAGEVYQVNLCRLLSAALPEPRPVLGDLASRLAVGNPAPYAVVLDAPEADLGVVGASPELFLSRDGNVVHSGPIKGTGRTVDDLFDKDVAENVMIVDLVRNDLAKIAAVGSVSVPRLLALEQHPGLVHLVSTVRAELRPGVGWPELLEAASPPGSVSGAPKFSALRVIRELEPAARGPYCGAVGWVDADSGVGWLSVGIRTFWTGAGRLWFGTGAGITWGSDPAAEWAETELKAERLLGLASRTAGATPDSGVAGR